MQNEHRLATGQRENVLVAAELDVGVPNEQTIAIEVTYNIWLLILLDERWHVDEERSEVCGPLESLGDLLLDVVEGREQEVAVRTNRTVLQGLGQGAGHAGAQGVAVHDDLNKEVRRYNEGY